MREGPRRAIDAIGQLPDVEIDIAGAAVQFARIDAPRADWEGAMVRLSGLARDAVEAARALPSMTAGARAGAIAQIMGRHGYAGDTDTYESLDNANLIRVTERRRGLPVALGILWLHCARAAGWAAHGLDFPGHFLIAIEGGQPRPARGAPAQRVVIDVFAGGMMLEGADMLELLRRTQGRDAEMRPGMLQPMPARAVLLRLQRNIQLRRQAEGALAPALVCLEDMIRLAPDRVALWREAASLNERLGRKAAAIRCHTRILDLAPEGTLAELTRHHLKDLMG